MFKKLLWQFFSQRGELKFHVGNDWRTTEDFMKQTKYLMNYFGYSSSDFGNEFLIDLGCGPKLRSHYFEKSKIIAIDPLIDDYLSQISWSDIKKAWKYYSCPAEKFIPELQNSVRFIMCINVLDHTFDVDNILKNCYKYLTDDGEFLLSVDAHKSISILHPQSLDREGLEKLFEQTDLKIAQKFVGLGKIGSGYERTLGGEALTYILTK